MWPMGAYSSTKLSTLHHKVLGALSRPYRQASSIAAFLHIFWPLFGFAMVALLTFWGMQQVRGLFKSWKCAKIVSVTVSSYWPQTFAWQDPYMCGGMKWDQSKLQKCSGSGQWLSCLSGTSESPTQKLSLHLIDGCIVMKAELLQSKQKRKLCSFTHIKIFQNQKKWVTKENMSSAYTYTKS